MIKQLLVGLLCLASIKAPAQQTRDSVVLAVNNLLAAMRNADGVALQSCFSPNAVLQSIQQKDGLVNVTDQSIVDFATFISKESKGAADERITIQEVLIDGPLAMVWTPYQFFYKGKFSHCGVNVFQLVQLSTGWKIQYIIDTRRKTGCN